MVLQGCGDCGSWEKNIAVLVPSNSFSHYNGTISTTVLRICHFSHYTPHFSGALQLHSKTVLFLENCSYWILAHAYFYHLSYQLQKKLTVWLVESKKPILSIGQTPEHLKLSNECAFAIPSTDLYLVNIYIFWYRLSFKYFQRKQHLKNGGFMFPMMWAFCFCINSLSQTFLLCLKNVHYWWVYFLLCKSH